MDVVKKVFFTKMHGLGNDFVIIDRRKYSFSFDNNAIKKLSNRRTGIGFDQLILISQCNDGVADIKISIFNSDASEAESCGNASRCVGKMLMKEFRTKNLILETKGGLVDIEEEEDGMISVDMGLVKFNLIDQFRNIKIIGNSKTELKFKDSITPPSSIAPSPNITETTFSSVVRFNASAKPIATGTPEPTIALVQRRFLFGTDKCIEPAFPPETPFFLANNSKTKGFRSSARLSEIPCER